MNGWGQMCKKDRCLEPLSVENQRPGLWVKDHIWPLDSVCPRLLLSLEEIREPITALLNTVPLCDRPPSNLHTGSSVDHLGPASVIFPGRGSGFEAPCPRLWSIRPLMNEKAVKGHKAGVHVCVFLQSWGFLSVSWERAVPQSWSHPSVFHGTLSRRQNTLTHADQLWCKNGLLSEPPEESIKH